MNCDRDRSEKPAFAETASAGRPVKVLISLFWRYGSL
jgi:hypothetical protein